MDMVAAIWMWCVWTYASWQASFATFDPKYQW